MISIGIIVLSVLLAGGYFFTNRNSENPRKHLLRVPFIVGVGVLAGLINPLSLERVDQGNVGIKVKLAGDERGISDYRYETGWVICNDWVEQLFEFPTFQQHIEYDTMIVITKGGFPVKIAPSFNYSNIPNAVGDMFQNLRLDTKQVEQGWLKTAIIGSVNDVANKWKIDSIFNSREQFETAIVSECNKRVKKWFLVDQMRSNIVPPDELRASIVEKTQAEQKVQVANKLKDVAVADGFRILALARADSAKKVIDANASALAYMIESKSISDGMKLRQQQLSSLYVEYLKASAWDGKLPQTVLGNSTPMINIK